MLFLILITHLLGSADSVPLQEKLNVDYCACVFQAAAEFCPHSVGHYLGMDTHDTHLVSKGLGLHPGMVITVEPGIYISENNVNVPERFAILFLLNTTVVTIYLRFGDLINGCRPRFEQDCVGSL